VEAKAKFQRPKSTFQILASLGALGLIRAAEVLVKLRKDLVILFA